MQERHRWAIITNVSKNLIKHKSILVEQGGPYMGKIETLTKKLKNYLATDENILYVAQTSMLKDSVYPPQVIVTNKRLIIREDKLIGQELEDYSFRSVDNISVDEGLMFSTLKIKSSSGSERLVEGLPKKEAQEVMKYSREAQMR